MIQLEFSEKNQLLRCTKYGCNALGIKLDEEDFKMILCCQDETEARLIKNVCDLLLEVKPVSFSYLSKFVDEIINFSIEFKIYHNYVFHRFEKN